MQIVPLNYDLAKFCYSRSKFFLVKKDNPSLSLSQHLINILDEEFNNELLSKHGIKWKWVCCVIILSKASKVCNFQNKA